MNTETTALARQLVESPHWRIMDGMRLVGANGIGAVRVVFVFNDAEPVAFDLVGGCGCCGIFTPYWLPDLDDPATLGCVDEIAREAWDDPGLSVSGIYEDGVTEWMFNEGKPHGGAFYRARSVRQPSRSAALVAAILAAPGAR